MSVKNKVLSCCAAFVVCCGMSYDVKSMNIPIKVNIDCDGIKKDIFSKAFFVESYTNLLVTIPSCIVSMYSFLHFDFTFGVIALLTPVIFNIVNKYYK